MYILKDSSWLHLPGYGWPALASSGSRKRITRTHASTGPLRHGSQRSRVLADSAPARPVFGLWYPDRPPVPPVLRT